MYCQACGAFNPDDLEYCARCHQKLLVLSGGLPADAKSFEEASPDENISFDEHLLERISVLEEAVRRTAETVRQLLSALHKQERNILINQSGLATLRDVLERQRILDSDEWHELWEARMDRQLLALEKRERFIELRERIAALYKGERRKAFNALLEDAEYALYAFDVDRALEALRAAFKMDRDNHELILFLGETLFNEGDSEAALPYFLRLLATRPDHFEGLVYAGVIYHEKGDAGRAEKLLRRAVELQPDAFLPSFSLGAVYAGRGELARAVTLLERAVELDPVPQALFLLGSCLYEMGRLGQAIRHLKEAVRRDPAYEEAHHLLGLAFLDRRWNRKALGAFRQAERLNPRKLRYQDLVRYLSGQDRSPLPRVGKGAGRWLREAESLLGGDHPERALASFRKALRVEPENPTLLLNFALACLQLDRSRDAEEVTRRILELEPGEMVQATAYAALMEALRAEGRLREGNRIGRRFLAQGTSAFARTIAYYEMACNLAEMEESLDQALDYARRSLEQAPDELKQFPLAAVGWVHYKREEYQQAVEFLSRSSELGASAMNLTQLGMALLAAGEDDRARGVLARARELDARRGSLEQRMMQCMKDSSRLLERVRITRKK